jgi:hypothetical protein
MISDWNSPPSPIFPNIVNRFFFFFVWLRKKQLLILKAKYESVKLNWLIEERKCSCLFAFQSSADDHTLIFREMSKGLVYFNEWNSIGTHFLRASWECFFFSQFFKKTNWIFHLFYHSNGNGSDLLPSVDSKDWISRGSNQNTLPLNPSRKSLVSSKKKTLLCSFLFPINLTEVHTPPSKENNLFFVFPLCWAGSSLSSSFFAASRP